MSSKNRIRRQNLSVAFRADDKPRGVKLTVNGEAYYLMTKGTHVGWFCSFQDGKLGLHEKANGTSIFEILNRFAEDIPDDSSSQPVGSDSSEAQVKNTVTVYPPDIESGTT